MLLGGTKRSPVIVDVRPVYLADPAAPAQRQPYHSELEVHGVRGARETARLVAAVERYARRSLATLFRVYRGDSRRLVGVGIVAGSVADPASIANPHIRAHAAEGRLFREVIERAAKAARLRATVITEKALAVEATRSLGLTPTRLRAEVGRLGELVEGPWRAEQKAAALSA